MQIRKATEKSHNPCMLFSVAKYWTHWIGMTAKQLTFSEREGISGSLHISLGQVSFTLPVGKGSNFESVSSPKSDIFNA